MRRGIRGFSLKEVLVVVVALAVLLAILLPSISGARKSAQRAQCLANVRQLTYSFITNAQANGGRTLSKYEANLGGPFWASELIGYSSRVDTSKNLLLSAICPSAAKTGGGVGSASLAWGPSQQSVIGSPLVVGNQYGSYGLNGWLYRNNQEAIGVMCLTVSNLGNIAVTGNLVSLGPVGMSGNSSVSGAVISGGAITVGGSASVGTTKPNYPGLTLPDVDAMYANLAATPGKQTLASISGNTTLNFNTYPVIQVTGDANLKNATVVGSGALIVGGNFTGFPQAPGVTMNVVCLGMVSFNGSAKPNNFNGSIYSKGKFYVNTSNWVINGNVVTMGEFDCNGGTINAAPPPSFDTTTGRAGYLNSINALTANPAEVPIFGDCIWAEAWPAAADVIPANFNIETGDISNHLGRFYINRHSKAVNLGYLDGHAETVKLKDLKSVKWSNQF